jgi:hypothetical protein
MATLYCYTHKENLKEILSSLIIFSKEHPWKSQKYNSRRIPELEFQGRGIALFRYGNYSFESFDEKEKVVLEVSSNSNNYKNASIYNAEFKTLNKFSTGYKFVITDDSILINEEGLVSSILFADDESLTSFITSCDFNNTVKAKSLFLSKCKTNPNETKNFDINPFISLKTKSSAVEQKNKQPTFENSYRGTVLALDFLQATHHNSSINEISSLISETKDLIGLQNIKTDSRKIKQNFQSLCSIVKDGNSRFRGKSPYKVIYKNIEEYISIKGTPESLFSTVKNNIKDIVFKSTKIPTRFKTGPIKRYNDLIDGIANFIKVQSTDFHDKELKKIRENLSVILNSSTFQKKNLEKFMIVYLEKFIKENEELDAEKIHRYLARGCSYYASILLEKYFPQKFGDYFNEHAFAVLKDFFYDLENNFKTTLGLKKNIEYQRLIKRTENNEIELAQDFGLTIDDQKLFLITINALIQYCMETDEQKLDIIDEEKAELVKLIGTHNQKNSIDDKYIQDLREIARFFKAGETVPSDFNSIVNECFYEFLYNAYDFSELVSNTSKLDKRKKAMVYAFSGAFTGFHNFSNEIFEIALGKRKLNEFDNSIGGENFFADLPSYQNQMNPSRKNEDQTNDGMQNRQKGNDNTPDLQAAKEKYNEKSDLPSTDRKNISGNAVTKALTKRVNKKGKSDFTAREIYEMWEKSDKQSFKDLTGKEYYDTSDGIRITAENRGLLICTRCKKKREKGQLIAIEPNEVKGLNKDKWEKLNKAQWREAIHLPCLI